MPNGDCLLNAALNCFPPKDQDANLIHKLRMIIGTHSNIHSAWIMSYYVQLIIVREGNEWQSNMAK